MNNEKWMWMCFAVMFLAPAIVRTCENHEQQEIAVACVRSGGEWKVNARSSEHECVRP